MTQSEIIEALKVEYATRVANKHYKPELISLNEAELQSLFEMYGAPTLLTAFTVVGKGFSKQQRRINSKPHVLAVLKNIGDRILADAHSRGKEMQYQGSGRSITLQPTKAQQARNIKQEVEGVLDYFQITCTQEPHDWTLSSSTIQDLLKQHSVRVLKEAMFSLGQYPIEKASEAYDLLCWKCEQEALQQV